MVNELADKKRRPKVLHPDFAARMLQASNSNEEVPALHHGRLNWVASRINERFGDTVQKETVRKWYAGSARPRPDMMKKLADVLSIDEAWLALGQTAAVSEKDRNALSASATGMVNVLAGIIQMTGWHTAFPGVDDGRAAAQRIDLYTVFRGARYEFHVATGLRSGDEWKFTVPTEAINNFIVGGIRSSEFCFRFFEIETEMIEESGQRRSGNYELTLPLKDLREILSFSERL